MINTFYLQVNEENIVTDVVSYPYSDYIKTDLNVPLPPKLLSGCYRLVNGSVIYDEKLDGEEIQNRISILECENKALKEELTQIQMSLASLISEISKK